MNTMGSTCSLNRRRMNRSRNQSALAVQSDSENYQMNNRMSFDTTRTHQNFRRHSIDTEVPDKSIAALYPIEDNYLIDDDGRTRSPKSLVQLCTDTVCRNLTYYDGDLPVGIPQELVDDILRSLVHHSALNATTLRALRQCELNELPLSRCRGVSDEWLVALNQEQSCALPQLIPSREQCKEEDGQQNSHQGKKHHDNDNEDIDDPMDLLSCTGTNPSTPCTQQRTSSVKLSSSSSSSSSSSTSSFHSAVSTPPKLSCTDEGTNEGTNEQATNLNVCMDPTTQPPGMQFPFMAAVPSVTSQMTLLDLRGSHKVTDRGLLQLKSLSALEIVRLDNCYNLYGRGFVAFSKSHRMHTLTMSDCRCLTDEAIINISHLTSLTTLSLDGCRCISDLSLKSIGNLVNLRQLDLSQCDLITDSSLHYLQYIYGLEELSLGWCRSITDEGVHILCRQSGRREVLQTLCLARCQITDTGLAHLCRLTSLKGLDLNGCNSISSRGLGETLGALKQLESLDVSYCPGIIRSSWQGKVNCLKSLDLCYAAVKDSHIARLTHLPSLEEINFDSCPVGDWSIAHLADNVVPNLTSFNLADSDISDFGMVHLPKFEKLKNLSLFYCNISNAGLRHLASMTCLETLNLDSRDIGDDGMFYLRKLKNLRSLDVFSARITDIGCVHIAKIKSLESLELCGGSVGDLGCSQLASNLINLTSLNLAQNELITNTGASSLTNLHNLKALNLSNTRVNSEALVFFRRMKQLQSLALYGCRGVKNVSGIESLQSELPNLKCLRLSDPMPNEGTGRQDDDHDSSDEDMSSADESEVSSSIFAATVDHDDEEDQFDDVEYSELEDEDGDDNDDEEMNLG